MGSIRKTIVAGLLCVSTALTLCACAPKTKGIPVVSCKGNEITVNGKVVAQAYDSVYINRIDSSVVSLSVGTTVTDDGSVCIVNVDPDGNEIKLSSVIPDRDLYESAVVDKLNQPTIMVQDSVNPGPEVDMEAMEKVLCSYDEAMSLPFIMGYKGVTIIYTEDSGAAYSVSFDYDSGIIDSKYVPGDGLLCHAWLTGRVGYEITGMKLDGYCDHWAENSIEIDNYNGHTYYWFCVAYEDEEGNDTYYSVIAEETDKGYEAICLKQVEGPFVCCDIEEFGRILGSQL